ncbi:MAG: DNA-directed DNA polymerase [Cyanobacteria bacterium SBLK]|nr:DNA-directed DNA polymerase [Cyanobacteria bacterium SBLK]
MGGKSRLRPPISVNSDYRLIDRSDELADAIAPLKSAPFLGIDCETTGLDPYRHKVRLIQLAALDRPTIVIDCFAIPDLAPLRSLLSSPCLKIGHNLKFEWLMLTRKGLSLQPPFFDTYLAYRVLTAGLKKRLSLEAIAMKLLGIALDKTEQTSDFSGTLTPKQLQYAAMDAAILLPLYRILKAKLERAKLMPTAKLEFACLPATAQMELNGMYLDREKWKAMGDRLKQQQARLKTQLDRQLKRPLTQQVSLLPELTETINPRSSQQVKAALAAQNILVPSASAQQLLPLAKKHPVIQTLLDYRSLSARISTFAEGVLEHIHPVSDRIHPHWFQLGTRSGRFSCQQPNLQHIPRAVEIRQCFVAPPGKVLIKADYSQIELRIMAKASGDRRMMDAYRRGEDLHRLTAALVLGKAVGEVTVEERRLGKAINFGLIYGMGAKKLRATAAKEQGIEIGLPEASAFRKRFFESYGGIKAYHDRVRREWSRGRRDSRTLGGRRRSWGKGQKPRLNESINHPVQGTNADMTKLALALAWRRFQGTEVGLVAAIHDEIVLECPVELAEWAIGQLRRCMVKAGEYFIRPIPVEVEIRAVESWGE